MPRIYHRPPLFPDDGGDDEDGATPTPTDADDSIVLSDLVRTGEASRLRRRGAMRLDHAVVAPRAVSPDSDDPPHPTVFRFARMVEPPRTLPPDELCYTLFCGAPEPDDEPEYAPYTPSVLPLFPSSPSPPPRREPRSSGCGALIHAAASPRRRLGVWTAKAAAAPAVVALDAAYFDRRALAKIVKSACGCVREGVGCVYCGNALGTRYKPCKAAGEGIFTPHPRAPGPSRPAGASYWCAPAAAHGDFYVYTFFANAVSSTPPHVFPPRPSSHHRPRSQVDVMQSAYPAAGPSSSAASSPLATPAAAAAFPTDWADAPPAGVFARVLTASPAPLEDDGEDDANVFPGAFLGALAAQRTPVEPDPDGERWPDGWDGTREAPGSPDKAGDAMLLPDR